MELTYENFYEDFFINEKIGREKFYKEKYPQILKNNKNFFRSTIKDFLNYTSNYKFNEKNHNIMIWDTKFEKIINGLSDTFNFYMITTSVNKYRYAKNHLNCKIYIAHRWMKLVDKSYISHDLSYVNKAIDEVVEFIKYNNIKIIILGNDKLFIEKLLQYGADRGNIPTVIIQHGIYNEDSFKVLNTANTAEHFWTWSDYVKDIYLKYFPNACKDIKVIGYPLKTLKSVNKNDPSVLFLGNQYANYNKYEGAKYLEIAYTVYNVCKALDIKFIYRKHPSEIITDDYASLKNTISNNRDLLNDLNRASIIVGDVSSVMLEAALVGKHVVQIIWSERSNVGKTPMYSFTVKADTTYESILNAINDCILKNVPNKIEDYYLWTNNNLKKDIIKNIKELI